MNIFVKLINIIPMKPTTIALFIFIFVSASGLAKPKEQHIGYALLKTLKAADFEAYQELWHPDCTITGKLFPSNKKCKNKTSCWRIGIEKRKFQGLARLIRIGPTKNIHLYSINQVRDSNRLDGYHKQRILEYVDKNRKSFKKLQKTLVEINPTFRETQLTIPTHFIWASIVGPDFAGSFIEMGYAMQDKENWYLLDGSCIW